MKRFLIALGLLGLLVPIGASGQLPVPRTVAEGGISFEVYVDGVLSSTHAMQHTAQNAASRRFVECAMLCDVEFRLAQVWRLDAGTVEAPDPEPDPDPNPDPDPDPDPEPDPEPEPEPEPDPEPQPAEDVAGAWTVVAANGVSGVLTLSQDGEDVGGTLAAGGLEVALSGTIEAAMLSLVGDPDVAIIVEVSGDSFSGQATGLGETQAITGTRGVAPDPEPEPDPEDPEPNPEPGPPGDAAWSEDFEVSSSQALWDKSTTRWVENVTIESGGPWGRYMRAHYPGGGVGGVAFATFDLPFDDSEIWVEVNLRFASDWRPEGDDKTFFAYPTSGSRWDVLFRSESQIYGFPGRADGSGAGYNFPEGRPIGEVFTGQWGRLSVHFRGGSPGIYEVWWQEDAFADGPGRLLESRAVNRPATFEAVRLGANADPFGSGIRDWDRLRVYRSDPGW